MAADEGDIEVDVDIQLEVLADMLANNPEFIEKVRLAMTKTARGKGNLYGTGWAQRQPKPSAVQPNSQQRVF